MTTNGGGSGTLMTIYNKKYTMIVLIRAVKTWYQQAVVGKIKSNNACPRNINNNILDRWLNVVQLVEIINNDADKAERNVLDAETSRFNHPDKCLHGIFPF